MNMNCSNTQFPIQQQLGLNIFPPILKSLSNAMNAQVFIAITEINANMENQHYFKIIPSLIPHVCWSAKSITSETHGSEFIPHTQYSQQTNALTFYLNPLFYNCQYLKYIQQQDPSCMA